MPKTLAAIPAYNEEIAIGSVVLRCRSHVDEVLVIDDGSEDRTVDVAKMAGATVHRHPANVGKGTAVQSALAYARANDFDAMVLLDGDGQHDPAYIPELLEPVLRGDADVVLGVRSRATSGMPIYRRFGQRALDLLTAVGAMDSVTDSQCGFRALSRNAMESLVLEERAFGVESEMLIEAKEKHLSVAEVPISVRYDVEGSTQGAVHHGFGVIDRLIRIIAVRHPLLFFAIPGLVLFAIGLWLGFDTLNFYNVRNSFPVGKALLSIIFLLLGALAVFAGLILNVMPRALARIIENSRLTAPRNQS